MEVLLPKHSTVKLLLCYTIECVGSPTYVGSSPASYPRLIHRYATGRSDPRTTLNTQTQIHDREMKPADQDEHTNTQITMPQTTLRQANYKATTKCMNSTCTITSTAARELWIVPA